VKDTTPEDPATPMTTETQKTESTMPNLDINRSDVLRRIIPQIFPMSAAPTMPTEEIDFHLLSVMFVLALSPATLNETFPIGGPVSATALHNLGVDPVLVTNESIAVLEQYRSAFSTMAVAWLAFAAYTEPPCPPYNVLASIVQGTKSL
jgi:hypothetical protein